VLPVKAVSKSHRDGEPLIDSEMAAVKGVAHSGRKT
jgi:hypothetical protein